MLVEAAPGPAPHGQDSNTQNDRLACNCLRAGVARLEVVVAPHCRRPVPPTKVFDLENRTCIQPRNRYAPAHFAASAVKPALAPSAKPASASISAASAAAAKLAKPATTAAAKQPNVGAVAAAASAACGTKQAASTGGATVQLKLGDVVRVGKHTLEVSGELGRGNFGVVWEVRVHVKPSSQECSTETPQSIVSSALKISTPSGADSLDAAVFEVEVLRRLANDFQESEEAPCHVPRYLAHQISSVASGRPGKKSVSLLMSKMVGGPMDKWLYGPAFSDSRLKSIPIAELLDGPLPGSRLATQGLEGAAATAAKLLSQMAPVFSKLGGIAYHRDISAHNFLVHEEANGDLTFSLIDFGLAVRSDTWHREYRRSNLAGTPNYFPPTTWMLFAYGHRYLEEHPNQSYLRQYQERLDHFAVGVLCLETFFCLWDGNFVTGSKADSSNSRLREARKAWRSYWKRAVEFYKGFFNKGGSKFRQTLQGTQHVSYLAEAMNTLLAALRAAANTDDSFTGRLLGAAAELLDPVGHGSWADVPNYLRARGSNGSDISKGTVGSTAMLPRTRTYSHRRVWTVDEAVSLKRGVADVDLPQHEETPSPPNGSPSAAAGRSETGSPKLEQDLNRPGTNDTSDPASSSQSMRPRKYSHRRIWTVDESMTMKRGSEMNISVASVDTAQEEVAPANVEASARLYQEAVEALAAASASATTLARETAAALAASPLVVPTSPPREAATASASTPPREAATASASTPPRRVMTASAWTPPRRVMPALPGQASTEPLPTPPTPLTPRQASVTPGSQQRSSAPSVIRTAAAPNAAAPGGEQGQRQLVASLVSPTRSAACLSQAAAPPPLMQSKGTSRASPRASRGPSPVKFAVTVTATKVQQVFAHSSPRLSPRPLSALGQRGGYSLQGIAPLATRAWGTSVGTSHSFSRVRLSATLPPQATAALR